MKDPWQVLGVAREASPSEIKKAYRKLAHQYHPDKNQNDQKAEERFKEVSEAYNILTDPKAKEKWERSQGGGFGGFGGFDWSSVTDIFSQFGRRNQSRASQRVVTDVFLTFKESCFGVEKEVQFSYNKKCDACDGIGAKEGDYVVCGSCGGSGQNVRKLGNMTISGGKCSKCNGKGILISNPCNSCHGEGYTVTTDSQRVQFPSCIDSGTMLNFQLDQESVLTIRVFVKEPENQVRNGIDIYAKHKISLKQALLGGKIKVRTLHGEKVVSLKECTGPDSKVRLKKCGAKHPHKEEYGHYILVIDVDFPESLTKEQKKKIEEVFNDI